MKQRTYTKNLNTKRGTDIFYRRMMRNQMVSKNLKYQSGEIFNRKKGYVWNVKRVGFSVVVSVTKN